MPNGGSDCCGTCWFNARNQGEPGFPRDAERRSQPSFCEIRNLPIQNAFWTYCSNHPHHNPGRLRIPVGPVYHDTGGYPYGRTELTPSPDTEEVRLGLLELAREATAESARGYPAGLSLVEGAIRQLGEFRETRAIPSLDQIRELPTQPATDEPFARNPGRLVSLARQALSRCIPPETVAAFRSPEIVAIAEGYAASGEPAARRVLSDALEAAGCADKVVLGYLRTTRPAASRCWVVDVLRGVEPVAEG